MNNCDYIESHTLAEDEIPQNPNINKVQCTGCCKLTEEPYTCEICSRDFCVVEGCIDLNYKGTGMDICLNCQSEKEYIIARLVSACTRLTEQVNYYEEKENHGN